MPVRGAENITSQDASDLHRSLGRSVEFVNQTAVEDENANTNTEHTPLTNGANIQPSAKTSNFYIYFSHFLTKWAERMWTFAVGLYMIYITPDSLQLTAVYGLSMCATILLFGPVVGDWVDNVQRLRAARVTLILQTLCVILCSAVIYGFLTWREWVVSLGDWAKYVTYGLIIALVAASLLANTANTITVERDWVVQMCAFDNDKLSTMTARMKSIDLTTQILAPVATGQIMTFLGEDAGAIFIAGWNIVTVFLEYYLLWKVYSSTPALQSYKDVSKSVSAKTKAQSDQSSCFGRCRIFSSITTIWKGWKTYANCECFIGGLALACLYMTVLGFDSVTVGYAKFQGLSDSLVGIMMGLAGLCGIIGTFAYPVFRRKLGLPRGGMVAMAILLSLLSLCIVSLWLPGSPFEVFPGRWEPSNDTMSSKSDSSMVDSSIPLESIMVLMTGIISARFGLWISDLSINQMFMLTVKEEERGIVFGVQNSINQLMNMIKFGMVTALPLPAQFGYLVIISFSLIALGNLFYLVFYCRLPRNLFSTSRDVAKYTKI